ncbi:outer membrane protein assembly factor BamB family protein [Plantactinospora soyae]|uniref:Outer membrane protein assembly factor BamB n=1 Tax=Plantactinospora soyae TaxID=1544732 RepID=A0A927MCJ0_9ACTN|nr:PQQ-binding-like beta-propeller repeat protein [Plantactinospora soyae]MBE1491232.1 outer membrane protein assembly factor BamB [Plantactinospora soyae]
MTPGRGFRTLWRRPLHQRGSASALAIVPGHLLVHERHTRLVDLDPTDGVARWEVPIGTWPRDVVVDGTQCWVISQDRDELRCLDLHSGEVRWSAALPRWTAQVVVVGDVVLVGGWRGYTALRAFDRWDGTPRWKSPDRVRTVLPARVGDGPQVLTGGHDDNSVRLLDVRDGAEITRWAVPEPICAVDSGPAFAAVGEDRFLIRCGERTVWQIRPGADEAGEFFRHDRALVVTSPYPCGPTVWVREVGGGVVALDAATGQPRWRVDLGRATADGVVPTGAGYVLAAVRPGTLSLVDATGAVVDRVHVDQQVGGLRDLAADTLLVVGKGSLTAGNWDTQWDG